MNQETSRVLLTNRVFVKLPPPSQLIHSRLGALGDRDLAMTDRIGILGVLTIGRGGKVHLGQQHLLVPDHLASSRQQRVGSTRPINLDLRGSLGRTADDTVLRIVQMAIGLPAQRQRLTGLDGRRGQSLVDHHGVLTTRLTNRGVVLTATDEIGVEGIDVGIGPGRIPSSVTTALCGRDCVAAIQPRVGIDTGKEDGFLTEDHNRSQGKDMSKLHF